MKRPIGRPIAAHLVWSLAWSECTDAGLSARTVLPSFHSRTSP